MRHPTTPRGIRNYNPGNIERNGTRWQGMSPDQSGDPRFVVFTSPVWGIRAIARTLVTYQDQRRAADGSAIDSVRELIGRWAPAHENDTGAYAAAVASALGVGVEDECVDVYDYATMRALVLAIVRHENGAGPLPGGLWYGEPLIAEGLSLAGIVPGVRHG